MKRPPLIVALAVSLLALTLVAIGIWQLVVMFPNVSDGTVTGPIFVGTAAYIAVRAWLIFKVWRGRNWARIALAVTVVLTLLGELLRWIAIVRLAGWQRMGPGLWLLLLAVQPAVTALATILLFTPPAASWFRRPRSV